MAAGYHIDGEQFAVLLLRNVDGQWESVGEDVVVGSIDHVAFASADVAWAWGSFTAYRSRDAGRTWEDVRLALPREFRENYGIDVIAFVDASTGYIAGSMLGDSSSGTPANGPFIWRTDDGGATWDAVEGFVRGPEGIFFAFGVRAGAGEILRARVAPPEVALITQRVDRVAGEMQAVSSESPFPNDITAIGERGWVALTEHPSDGSRARPAIFTSERPGAPWIAQTLPDVVAHDLEIDFCDGNVGIVGAQILDALGAPVAFWTDDGGAEWQTSALDLPAGSTLNDVACVSSRDIVLVAQDGERAFLVRSEDGGRTFDPVDLPVEGRHAVYGITSNAAFQ